MERMIKMDMPHGKSNATYRRQLQNGKERYGIDADDLNPDLDKPFPECYVKAFGVWETIRSTAHELAPVKLGEIESYFNLYRDTLCPYEIDALLSVDRSFIKYVQRVLSKPTGND